MCLPFKLSRLIADGLHQIRAHVQDEVLSIGPGASTRHTPSHLHDTRYLDKITLILQV